MSGPRSAEPVANLGPLDFEHVRNDFPALDQSVHGKPLVYLDSGATTQKPRSVIDAVAHYYAHDNANVHRGVHELSERATASYEGAREKVRAFINAPSVAEVVFSRGTTESINLMAQSYGRPRLQRGDEILITEMEHHSNIVPWQLLCEQTGAALKVAPIDDTGQLIVEEYRRRLNERTRIVAMVHISNALGTINPVAELIGAAHDAGAVVIVDGAQAAAHVPIDVQALDCDFYAMSSHKVFGPTGIGALYGKRGLLEDMPPYQGGGDMIEHVSFEKTTYNEPPYKFEAGTPNIAGAAGFGAALDYVTDIGLDAIRVFENNVFEYATGRIAEMDGARIIGTASSKCSIVSFLLGAAHPSDIGTILDRQGVAIRTGHHCAMPVMRHFGVPGTARASFAMYNNRADVDTLVEALRVAERILN
ncbi:MAG: Cysteine desulfurase SufS [Gammaproteobacteria bacterium]|nr:Cysteine desulfurase SufS [Gammaproteobacteria bacterium]